ncbi:MAG TPA: membrane protein insertion efficiency factor YidD [Longimicrobium sp.]|nr:membrane protein insertion efficiency factor YidD [Longimicrobium sp.]
MLLAIGLYWVVWPERFRRGCLYRESCSRHVYRVTRAQGLRQGARALVSRYRTCRPGYAIVAAHGQRWLSLADGSFIPASEAAPRLLAANAEQT